MGPTARASSASDLPLPRRPRPTRAFPEDGSDWETPRRIVVETSPGPLSVVHQGLRAPEHLKEGVCLSSPFPLNFQHYLQALGCVPASLKQPLQLT